MLKIRIPDLCIRELRYSLDILLGEFLSVAFEVKTYDGDVIEISRLDALGKLTTDASFFSQLHKARLKRESMPVLPLQSWSPLEDGIEVSLVESRIPVLYGRPGLVKNDNHLHFNFDIFGSAFFMLSRYEELIAKDRDQHDRFPATASVAFKAGVLGLG